MSVQTLQSTDGTTIAYQHEGSGAPVVIVNPALHDRSAHQGLADQLATRFTVYRYDRRGRGDSGDTAPYALQREIEDLDAVINAAGAPAFVFSSSSGAALALEAALAGSAISAIAAFEPPYVGTDPAVVAEYARLIDADDRAGALEYFHRAIGLPEEMVSELPASPNWPAMQEMAPTLLYDFQITSGDGTGHVPADRLAELSVATLVICSDSSPDELRDAARDTARAVPDATFRSLPGEWHGVSDDVLAAELVRFFGDRE